MLTCTETIRRVAAGGYDRMWPRLYPGRTAGACRDRMIRVAESFRVLFGDRPVVILSAPGRVEIGGNHTDHQHGRVLAAAVDLDILCAASPRPEPVARIHSEGFPPDAVELDDLAVRASEQGHSAALIRGVAAWLDIHGYPFGGFDAYMVSDVKSGSGLSSSAAYEVAVGGLFRALYGGAFSDTELALAGQWAENHYFGKPCGLMDQTASALGGLLRIDFEEPQAPVIDLAPYEEALHGYRLCIVNTGGSHADLTREYAAIPEEMGRAAAFFGQTVLRQVDRRVFYEQISRLRAAVGDRAVLRTMHFFDDNERAPLQAGALACGDTAEFLSLVKASGRSSLHRLQNVLSATEPRAQGLALALALSEHLLDGKGAWRVHGGGFAGTVEAFVPDELLDAYRAQMDEVFGAGACQTVSIRPAGVSVLQYGEDI